MAMSDGCELSPVIEGSPEEILTYVHEMLHALAELAAAQGDTVLAAEIWRAWSTPHRTPPRH